MSRHGLRHEIPIESACAAETAPIGNRWAMEPLARPQTSSGEVGVAHHLVYRSEVRQLSLFDGTRSQPSVWGIAVDPSTDSLLSVSCNSVRVWTDLRASGVRLRYCVLACLSSLTSRPYAGPADAEGGGGGGDDDDDDDNRGGRLQGVKAFDCIASADVWRHVLEFV